MLKDRWFKTYNFQKTIHSSIHSLSLSTAKEVVLMFCLRWLWYSDCIEYERNAMEHIPALYQ